MLRAIVSAFYLSLLWIPDARSQAIPPVVDVELVLAVDVSWSMDLDEQSLQREGYVDAIRDPEVVDRHPPRGLGPYRGHLRRVGRASGLQRTVVPWTIIELAGRGGRVRRGARRRRPSAACGARRSRRALIMSAAMFDNGIDGMRRVIDVSGDGPNNMGPAVTAARDSVLRRGHHHQRPADHDQASAIRGGFFPHREPRRYYEDCVIGGFGAFMITVDEQAQFGRRSAAN